MSKVLLYSGGLDSTVLLYSDPSIRYALTFIYGAKNNPREIESAKLLCNVEHVTIPLPLPWTSPFLEGKIPQGYHADPRMASNVIPFRNGIMLSIAAGFAAHHGASAVLIAAYGDATSLYPDCRAPFMQSMSEATWNGCGVTVEAPFQNMTKAQVVALGLKLNAPLEATWTCYTADKEPCLKCGACTKRTEAFLQNQATDPALSSRQWKQAVEYLKQCTP